MVDAGLATEGGIDLRRHRSGNLHNRKPAQIARRGEAREIADDAPAKSKDDAGAIELRGDQTIVNLLERGSGFTTLACRDLNYRSVEAGI